METKQRIVIPNSAATICRCQRHFWLSLTILHRDAGHLHAQNRCCGKVHMLRFSLLQFAVWWMHLILRSRADQLYWTFLNGFSCLLVSVQFVIAQRILMAASTEDSKTWSLKLLVPPSRGWHGRDVWIHVCSWVDAAANEVVMICQWFICPICSVSIERWFWLRVMLGHLVSTALKKPETSLLGKLLKLHRFVCCIAVVRLQGFRHPYDNKMQKI